MTNPIVVVGGDAIAAGGADELRRVAVERRVGMLNTFAAKGLFAWNDPAHLGTIGLQERDLELAGIALKEVLLVGVPEREISKRWLASVYASWHDVRADELDALLTTNVVATPRPPLYWALASVCGPLYGSDAAPLNPARAAADLATWLPPGAVVRARADAAGFWLARTFPTRELGSVRFDDTRFNDARFNDTAAATLHVVSDLTYVDGLDAVIEHWTWDGPSLTSSQRLGRLSKAIARGGRAVLPLAVDWSALKGLYEVAGPPLWH